MKRRVERLAKRADVVFTDEWQNKFLACFFGIMCVMCFVAGFWNYIHFLFAGMAGGAAYLINEK